VVGGGCLEPVIRAEIGTSGRDTMRISQSGMSLSGALTNDETGLGCRFTGTISGSQIALTFTACDVTNLRRRCQAGELRDMELFESSGDATVSGDRIMGTITDTWNTFVAGSRTEAERMLIQFSFSVSR